MDDPSRNCNAVMEILKPCLNQLSLEPNMKPLDLIRSVLRQCIKYYPDYNVVIIKKGQVFYIPDKIDGLIYQEIHTFKRKAFGVKIANIANIAITYELQILIFKSGSLTVLCDPLKGSKWGYIGNFLRREGTHENIFVFGDLVEGQKCDIFPPRPVA